MKLRRLILGRYGHLTDVVLDFPETPGLHVVLGANEAGKSTALTAIGDCLFGFPHRTPYAFLHATRDLRIGAALQAGDGRQATFVPAQGTQSGPVRRPGPAAAAKRHRGIPGRGDAATVRPGLRAEWLRTPAGRRRDPERPRRGRRSDPRRTHRPARISRQGRRAEAEAGKLYGDRRGRRAFHEAADRFNQARHASLNDGSSPPPGSRRVTI